MIEENAREFTLMEREIGTTLPNSNQISMKKLNLKLDLTIDTKPALVTEALHEITDSVKFTPFLKAHMFVKQVDNYLEDHEHINDALETGISSNENMNVSEELDKHMPQVDSVPFTAFNKGFEPGYVYIWALGVSLIGGQMLGWNIGLASGFGMYLVAQVLMGLAYIILICGLAEVCSSTAYSGGAYGMTRVVIGFYPGFVVACCELLEYVLYISASILFLSLLVCEESGLGNDFVPVISLAFYLFFLIFLLNGGSIYWRFVLFLGVICVIITMLYCLGAIGYTDFVKNASLHQNNNPTAPSNWFNGRIVAFLEVLPLGTWGFGGVEAAALMTDLVHRPKVDLPYGIVAATVTLFVTMMAILFVSCSIAPGIIDFSQAYFVVQAGFEAFGFSTKAAAWMWAPCQIAFGFGLILPSARLLYFMSDSKFFPPLLANSVRNKNYPGDPRFAVIAISIICYGFTLLGIYWTADNLVNIGIVLGFITYFADLTAYCKMQTDFQLVQRKFRSPFGISGAIFAFIVFGMGLVGSLGYQSQKFDVGLYVACFIGSISIFYFTYASSRQVLSEAEQRSLLVLHTIVYNKHKTARITHRRRNWWNLFKANDYKCSSYSSQSTSFNNNSTFFRQHGIAGDKKIICDNNDTPESYSVAENTKRSVLTKENHRESDQVVSFDS